uniref:ABC transporter permease n=1 Tax=Roseihalotalea indica TaxID=2867963 RepID=A0AA49GSQ6_9BACT|nr:ABC transporter permease [Tunicatimonas sp. TK19036]
MLKNYLITTLRNFRRNTVNTVINVSGLTLSLACCIVIYAFVKHEYSFDHWHEKADRTFRVVSEYQSNGGTDYNGYVSYPVAEALRQEFADMETATRVIMGQDEVVKIQEGSSAPKLFQEEDAVYTDEFFLKTFDYQLLAAQSDNLLSTPEEVVLTRELADKFYGNSFRGKYEELLGKTLMISQRPYQITGVLEDPPRNTSVTFHMLLPLKDYEKRNEWLQNWDNTSSDWSTFVTLPEGQSPAQFEERLAIIPEKYFKGEDASRHTYLLQPLPEVHTDEQYGGTNYPAPAILIVAFVTMGIIVLLTACINFINLATAQSVKRAKEIGIRKALGSLKWQLMLQFMSETFLLSLIASVLAYAIAREFVQVFNQYLSVVIDYGLTLDMSVLYFLVGLILVVTCMAGYYPARVLSGFRPVEALKQSINAKQAGFAGKFSLRKTLVVTQFVISQLLIIGTIIVASQMRYVRERDLGFATDDVAVLFVPGGDVQGRETFRNKLTAQAAISEVSFNTGPPMSSGNNWTDIYNPAQGEESRFGINQKRVDPQYLSTFEIELLAGRNLREEDEVLAEDSTNEYNVLINEKAMRQLGFASPAEALDQMMYTYGQRKAKVVGVIEDFINAPLQEEIYPCMLHSRGTYVWMASIKLTTPQPVHELTFMKEAWQEIFPDHFYNAMTLDEYFRYGAFYVIEDLMYQGFRLFAFIAIAIGCMGLYGLISYLALQRRKEIGVRKTLGASIQQILYLFSKEFTWLVLLAFIIAAPVGYFAMQAWLETFVDKIPITPIYFALAFLVSILITLVTVGYKSLHAALANPVESLRNE